MIALPMHDWKLKYRPPHCCNMELLGFKEYLFFLDKQIVVIVCFFVVFLIQKKVKALCESQNCLARPVAFTNKLI